MFKGLILVKMSTKVCLFCLKSVKPKEEMKGTRIPTQTIDCCLHCNSYVSVFCDLFKKWEVLRFQLNESLESLLNIMVAASRSDNCFQYQSGFENQDEYVKKLRTPIIKMSKSKIGETLPQVVITPVYLIPTAPTRPVPPSPPETEVTWEPIRIELESVDLNPDGDINENMDFVVDDKNPEISTTKPIVDLFPLNTTVTSSTMEYQLTKPPTGSPFVVGVPCPTPKIVKIASVTKVRPHQALHSGYSRAQYKCRVCKVPFSSYSSYRRHITRSQSHKQKVESRKKESAALKFGKLSSPKTPEAPPLISPIKADHVADPSFELKPPRLDPYFRACRCNLCSQSFLTETNLCTHKLRVHWNNRCPSCGFQANSKHKSMIPAHMRLHFQRKHPELFPELPFTCGTCKCQLATQESLDEHQEKLHPKSFQCPHCEMTCESKQALYRHEMKDHDIKRFACSVCKKPFADIKSLNRHAGFHTDPSQWKYSCEFCGKKFLKNSDLKRHKLGHTNERPYACDICGQRFVRSFNVKMHKERAHKSAV